MELPDWIFGLAVLTRGGSPTRDAAAGTPGGPWRASILMTARDGGRAWVHLA